MVLELGVADLVDGTDDAQQSEAVGIVEEGHEASRQLVFAREVVGGEEVADPGMVSADVGRRCIP